MKYSFLYVDSLVKNKIIDLKKKNTGYVTKGTHNF